MQIELNYQQLISYCRLLNVICDKCKKDLTPTDDPILVSELFSTEDQCDYSKIIKYHIMHYVSSPHGSGPQRQEGAVTSFLTFQL